VTEYFLNFLKIEYNKQHCFKFCNHNKDLKCNKLKKRIKKTKIITKILNKIELARNHEIEKKEIKEMINIMIIVIGIRTKAVIHFGENKCLIMIHSLEMPEFISELLILLEIEILLEDNLFMEEGIGGKRKEENTEKE